MIDKTENEDFDSQHIPDEKWDDEGDLEDDNWQPCDDCDLPDACADFGCAIKQGIRKPLLP